MTYSKEALAEINEKYLGINHAYDILLLGLISLDLVIKSDNHPLNTLVIRRLKIDRADPAVS